MNIQKTKREIRHLTYIIVSINVCVTAMIIACCFILSV